MSRRRNLAYVGSALAVVSAITSIVAWWVPSSAIWLDHHGFIAWPLAVLSLLLFVWTALNWQQTARELATVRAEMHVLVPADRQLYADFKNTLPKDSPVLVWLRHEADTRMFHRSDIAPLSDFAYSWRETDQHFVNPELEQAAQRLVECSMTFLSYQRQNAFAAHAWTAEDPIFEYPTDGDDRKRSELDRGLGQRADNILAAHNELYMIGSRLGL